MPALTLLSLEPQDHLVFVKTPQSSTPSKTLTLTNDSDVNVAFKVKTTAPKSYVVKPSYGTLKPHEHMDVQIILQSTDVSISSHRFLVQAVTSPSNTEEVQRDQWSTFTSETIQSTKLTVALEERDSDPAGSNLGESNTSKVPADMSPEAKKQLDELNKRVAQLEKEKQMLLQDKKKLSSGKGSKVASGGFTALHLVLAALVTFGVMAAANHIM
uniref:MSP domain-containing protein n=1 Tax=Noctiluca scintillans TaxID=2966 RepID=A0A7S1AIR8_NOCSC